MKILFIRLIAIGKSVTDITSQSQKVGEWKTSNLVPSGGPN